MNKNRTISPDEDLYNKVSTGIKKEKKKLEPRFHYDNVTHFISVKMREFARQFRLPKAGK